MAVDDAAGDDGCPDGEIVIEDDEVGVLSGLDGAFSVVDTQQACGVGGDGADGLCGRAAGEGYQPAEQLVEPYGCADESAVGPACDAGFCLVGAAGGAVVAAVGQAEGAAAVGDCDNSLWAEQPPGEADCGGVDVRAVGYKLRGNLGRIDECGQRAGRAVMKACHSVKEVGYVRDACGEGVSGIVEGGVGMAECGDDVGLAEPADELHRARQLRRYGHHSQPAAGVIEDCLEDRRSRRADELRLDACASVGADERAFEVDAEDGGAGKLSAGGIGGDGEVRVVGGGLEKGCRQQACYAEACTGAADGLEGLVGGVEYVFAAGALDVYVDKARCEPSACGVEHGRTGPGGRWAQRRDDAVMYAYRCGLRDRRAKQPTVYYKQVRRHIDPAC